jgi:hypothetical protein
MSRFARGSAMAFVILAGPAVVLLGAGPRGHRVQFGVDTYLGIYHLGTELGSGIRPTATDRTNYLDAVRDLGVSTIREDIGPWSEIQPKEGGKYHFHVIDDIVRKASDRGIDILALVYFFPPWATLGENRPWSFEPQGQDGRYQLPLRKHKGEFEDFIRTLVTRYCGCQPDSLQLKKPIKEWLFMNEPEGYGQQFLDPNQYAYWLKIFYEQIKSVDPAALVVAPAIADPGIWRGDRLSGEFVERLLSSDELQGPHYPYFDVLDFHPYPRGMGPPSPNLYGPNISYAYLRQVMLEHNLSLPMWVTEIGDDSIHLNLQADRIVKYVVQAASTGVDRVYVLGLWDFSKKLNHGHAWGLLQETPSGQMPVRKPSFIAYKTLLHQITDNQGIEFLGPGRYQILRDSGKPLYVLWAEAEDSAAPAFLHGRLRVTNLENQTTEIDTKELKLTEHPVLVHPLE